MDAIVEHLYDNTYSVDAIVEHLNDSTYMDNLNDALHVT